MKRPNPESFPNSIFADAIFLVKASIFSAVCFFFAASVISSFFCFTFSIVFSSALISFSSVAFAAAIGFWLAGPGQANPWNSHRVILLSTAIFCVLLRIKSVHSRQEKMAKNIPKDFFGHFLF